jgi:hypothetical protein
MTLGRASSRSISPRCLIADPLPVLRKMCSHSTVSPLKVIPLGRYALCAEMTHSLEAVLCCVAGVAQAWPYPSMNVHDLHTVDRGVWQHLLPLLLAPEGGHSPLLSTSSLSTLLHPTYPNPTQTTSIGTDMNVKAGFGI